MAVTTRKTPIKYRRGKPMPRIRHGDLIDLTTFPLRSRPLSRAPITVCSECGRKGEYAAYRTGGERWNHVVRFETLFWMVKDSCHVGKIG